MPKKFLIANLSVVGALLICFLTITIVLSVNNFAALPIDSAIARWAYDVRGAEGGATYWFFRIITEFGYTYFAIAIVVIMGIIWRFRSKTWFFGGTILISWILQNIIKLIIMRPRPDENMWWMIESSSSFPSGHSITVACIFVLLAYFVLISPKLKPWLKYTLCSIFGCIVTLVGISRIILGVHYFTDVLAGIFFGSLIAVLGILLYNVYLDRINKKTLYQKQKDSRQIV